MNKRIRELMEQAGGNPNYSAFSGHFLPPPPDYIDPATVDLEKFAKLIIRECCAATEGQPRSEIRNSILKHFGIDRPITV